MMSYVIHNTNAGEGYPVVPVTIGYTPWVYRLQQKSGLENILKGQTGNRPRPLEPARSRGP